MPVENGRRRATTRRAPQKVQVFSLARPRPGAQREQRRYYVKWRVDGCDKTRSFKTRAEAERFRSGLQLAIRDGQHFDMGSGLPAEWVEPPDAPTWWSWSREWVAMKWPQWSGHTRRSGVESLALLAPLLVRPGAPPAPPGLGEWLRGDGYRPGGEATGERAAWLDRWSIHLPEIEPELLEDVLNSVSRRADGASTVPAVTRRRRNTLGAVLRSAVRRGVIPTNPMDRTEWRAPRHSMAIDVSTVPSPGDVDAIVDHVTGLRGDGRRCAALFALVGISGMRPSEAIGLKVDDLELPTSGWGLASVRGAITSPGGRYTTAGTPVESKGLKHRAQGSIRDVPLSPDVVAALRQHLAVFEPVGGRLFSNGAGRPMTASNYGPVWGRARSAVWPAGHKLGNTTVYDLRHGAATMMLRSKVSPAEVALRLGHSVDVLMRVYAGVFSDERERSNQLIDDALREAKDRRSGS